MLQAVAGGQEEEVTELSGAERPERREEALQEGTKERGGCDSGEGVQKASGCAAVRCQPLGGLAGFVRGFLGGRPTCTVGMGVALALETLDQEQRLELAVGNHLLTV